MVRIGSFSSPENEIPTDTLVDFSEFDNNSSGLAMIESFAGHDNAKLQINIAVAWVVAFRYSPGVIRGNHVPTLLNVTSDDLTDQLIDSFSCQPERRESAGLRKFVLDHCTTHPSEFKQAKNDYLTRRAIMTIAGRTVAETELIKSATDLHHAGESYLNSELNAMSLTFEGSPSDPFMPELIGELCDEDFLKQAYRNLSSGRPTSGLRGDTLKRLHLEARYKGLIDSSLNLDPHTSVI